MPKYNLLIYPSFRAANEIWRLPHDRRTEIENKISELNDKYFKTMGEADDEFDRLPSEEKTPDKSLEILEKHFKLNKLGYALFKGLEAANREEARELAERYARYALVHEKGIPEELKGYVELDHFSVLTLPYAESVKLDPPNTQNQASIGDTALIATSIMASLIPIAWTIYNWIKQKR
jgi:hypothetical protein